MSGQFALFWGGFSVRVAAWGLELAFLRGGSSNWGSASRVGGEVCGGGWEFVIKNVPHSLSTLPACAPLMGFAGFASYLRMAAGRGGVKLLRARWEGYESVIQPEPLKDLSW
jgi:hypothetical protein